MTLSELEDILFKEILVQEDLKVPLFARPLNIG